MKKQNLFFIIALMISFIVMDLNALTMRGTVKNQSGIPVNSVFVTAQHSQTGRIFTTNTNQQGQYQLKNLPTGIYTITLKARHYKSLVKKRVHIKENKIINFNFILENSKLAENEKDETKQINTAKEEMTIVNPRGQAKITPTKKSYFRHKGIVGGVAYNVSDAVKRDFNTEEYQRIYEDNFQNPKNAPLSTFSIDVDTASYSNTRRFINSHRLPYKDAVRIEEMINYFDYNYDFPTGKHPFSIYTEISSCPWNRDSQLLHIGIKGYEVNKEELPPSNLVFLIDVSGSMGSPAKLPLLKQSFKILVNNLSSRDRVAIAVYAGAAGLVLPSTSGNHKDKILSAIERLQSGGSTAGGAGIRLAYNIAMKNFINNGNNRVIIATDGDFNVGISSTSELTRMIEKKREKGIFLTALGFGTGNYKDSRMEQLADKGNGNYYYIDNILEGKKIFSNDMVSTLYTIAKDVKIQIEFNPAVVKSYRLIGYENRKLKAEDFNDDKKDAGALGMGHTVTALYEIIPANGYRQRSVDELKYQTVKTRRTSLISREMATVKFRYKKPDGFKSRLITKTIYNKILPFNRTSDKYRFSAAVAQFGLLLRDSKYKGNSNYNSIIKLARGSKGKDFFGYRSNFINLAEKAQLLSTKN